MSSEDKDERRLQDVFIKTNFCWVIRIGLDKKDFDIFKAINDIYTCVCGKKKLRFIKNQEVH